MSHINSQPAKPHVRLTTFQHRFLAALSRALKPPADSTQSNPDQPDASNPNSAERIPWPRPNTFHTWLQNPQFVRALNKARQAMHAAVELSLLQGSTAAVAKLASNANIRAADPESTRRSCSDLIRHLNQLCPQPPDMELEDEDDDEYQPYPRTPRDNEITLSWQPHHGREKGLKMTIYSEFCRLHPEYNGYIPPPVPPDKLPLPWNHLYKEKMARQSQLPQPDPKP